MKVGWVGLGKLGLPCASVLAETHEVIGFDIRHVEAPFPVAASIDELGECEVVFVAVQTPHDPEYEGVTPMPEQTKGFDLEVLIGALVRLDGALPRGIPIAVVSTVLPGTLEPLRRSWAITHPVVYNPSFIAMGSVQTDFRYPEFVLIGADDDRAADTVALVYEKAGIGPVGRMSIPSAETVKMLYNTFISMKIVVSNTAMEICDAVGGDVDDVMSALRSATRRVASGAYFGAGLGDGGACHPRDAIAMSHVAIEHGLAADPFAFLVRAREAQARWLAERVARAARAHQLPVVILGSAYKANIGMEDGSAALLVGHYLDVPHTIYDPVAGRGECAWPQAVYLLAVPHDALLHEASAKIPAGSKVVDPWGMVIPQNEGVTVDRPGRA